MTLQYVNALQCLLLTLVGCLRQEILVVDRNGRALRVICHGAMATDANFQVGRTVSRGADLVGIPCQKLLEAFCYKSGVALSGLICFWCTWLQGWCQTGSFLLLASDAEAWAVGRKPRSQPLWLFDSGYALRTDQAVHDAIVAEEVEIPTV